MEEDDENPEQGGSEAAGVWIFFKAAVQSVLLFGAEMWVVTPCTVRVLGGLQYQVARRLTGRLPRRRSDGIWEYTSSEAARDEAGFEPMDTYIQRRQNTVVHYIAMLSIMDLCEAAERKWGSWVGMRWWEQAVLDLAGARETAAEANKDGLEE